MRELAVMETHQVAGGDHTMIANQDTSKIAGYNNPGNIKAGDFATRHGATGTSANGVFATFASFNDGRLALYDLLDHNYGDYTFNNMWSRYNADTPAFPHQAETEHDEIKNWITQNGGTLDWDKPLKDLTDMQFYYLTQGLIHHEGSTNVQTDIQNQLDYDNRPGPDMAGPETPSFSGYGGEGGFVYGVSTVGAIY